jgi:adenylate cyclase
LEELLSGERVERRLAAILAADVVSYSLLMGQDETGTRDRLRTHKREHIDPKIAEHRGRLVKTTGDGFLVEFPGVFGATGARRLASGGTASSIGIGDDPLRSITVTAK